MALPGAGAGESEGLVATRHRGKLIVPLAGGRVGWRAQGVRDRTSSKRRHDRDVVSARTPSTTSDPGTWCGVAAPGHPWAPWFC